MTHQLTAEYTEQELRHTAGEREDFSNTFNIGGAYADSQLAILRNKNTDTDPFRFAIRNLSAIVISEALKNSPQKDVLIETPLAPMIVRELAKEIVFVPILRSGKGMADAAKILFEESDKVSYLEVDLKRDEVTKKARWGKDLDQVARLGKGGDCEFIILDPMLATGGTATEVIKAIKDQYPEASIKMAALLSAPEGIRRIHNNHPEVPIYTASIDSHLNENAYIVPGLGDAGDRQFGPIRG